MRIRIFRAFASNNSGSYTLVGRFSSSADAESAAAFFADLCERHTQWHGDDTTDAPSPLDQAAALLGLPPSGTSRHDDEWPSYGPPPRVLSVDTQVLIHVDYPATMPRILGAFIYAKGGRVETELEHAHERLVAELASGSSAMIARIPSEDSPPCVQRSTTQSDRTEKAASRRHGPGTASPPEEPRRGGVREGAGRKRANPHARPNVPHRERPRHVGRLPVHVTLRARRGLPGFRNELVRNMMRDLLTELGRRAYAATFQVVHFSIQSDHVHLIVEASDNGLSKGLRGFAISFARRLNGLLRRAGKVWADRHHRRDLPTPTETRNTLLYVLQNYVHHGARTFGKGVVDPYSTAPRFDGWADEHAELIEPDAWPSPKPRTWMLSVGWRRARGGLLRTDEVPRIGKLAQRSPIVATYVPDRAP